MSKETRTFKLYTTVGIIVTADEYDKYKYVLHREDGPAVISYYTDRSIWYEEWYINGVMHREDGPAYIKYNVDRIIYYEAWSWCGMNHRHDYTQPSKIWSDARPIFQYYWYGVRCQPKRLLVKDFRDRIQLEQLG